MYPSTRGAPLGRGLFLSKHHSHVVDRVSAPPRALCYKTARELVKIVRIRSMGAGIISAHCGLTATPTQEFGRDDHIGSLPFDRGSKMIIDLDSWEIGYGDGLLGRPSQCTPGIDQLSYSSGYDQACAPSARQKVLPLPSPRSTHASFRLIII